MNITSAFSAPPYMELGGLVNASKIVVIKYTQPAFIFSKLTIETLEQGVKYVQSY